MKRPRECGTAIDARRYRFWISEFSGYRNPVTQNRIELWLDQFKPDDRDLAARILDAVLFIGNQHIHTSFREILGGISGWNIIKSKRQGRWFFVPFSGSVGESGDSMVHAFRMATSMSKKQYNNLFIHRSELPLKRLTDKDTVILIDDFSGTGDQACDSWEKLFSELITEGPRIVLILIAATTAALERISDETDLEPICGTTLRNKDGFFHTECTYFTPNEKERILQYCVRADRRKPQGYGDIGLLLVFAHRCPNNTIPILHSSNNDWDGLFPRSD